jgi:Anti-sigma factor NepR
MQTEAESRAAHSRLSRHVQRKLGETLQAMFDEIVKEGVPDRFVKLLEQIEEGRKTGPADKTADQSSKSNERDAIGSPDSLGASESQTRKSGKEGQG